MSKSLTFILLLNFTAFSFSQNDSIAIKKKKDRYIIWLIPSAATNIYGLAIGPVGSEAICNLKYTKRSHGINIQIPGQGFFQTFLIKNHSSFIDFNDSSQYKYKKAIHNGIIISLFGTFTSQINGISISPWMSLGTKVNGVSFNLLWNLYTEINGVSIGLVNQTNNTKGLQIGIINKTNHLKGIQLGLWNKNEKRALPILNWEFK